MRAASDVKDGTTTAAMKDSCAAQCTGLRGYWQCHRPSGIIQQHSRASTEHRF